MQTRTDFAQEEITKGENITDHTERINGLNIREIHILEPDPAIDKPAGTYITVEVPDCSDQNLRKQASRVVEYCCSKVMESHPDFHRVLVAGLGNQHITADCLGPLTARQIYVTAHLHQMGQLDDNSREVAVVIPGVMGQTGMETAQLIHSLSMEFHPDLIIAIDALATRNLSRINKIIQINDSGIQPGGGVGNHRRALNEEYLKVPVLSIGVATVTSVEALLVEFLEQRDPSLADSVTMQVHQGMVVTPKEMDEQAQHLSWIMAEGLNRFLFPSQQSY